MYFSPSQYHYVLKSEYLADKSSLASRWVWVVSPGLKSVSVLTMAPYPLLSPKLQITLSSGLYLLGALSAPVMYFWNFWKLKIKSQFHFIKYFRNPDAFYHPETRDMVIKKWKMTVQGWLYNFCQHVSSSRMIPNGHIFSPRNCTLWFKGSLQKSRNM